MSDAPAILHGGCHCTALRYELEWPADAPCIPARRCNCGYCTRFNGTWTSHPDAVLRMLATAEASPGRYRFGTQTADFLFCRVCGVTVAAACETGGRLRAVVNVNTLDDCDSLPFDRSDSDFSDEAVDRRLIRRTERWIGNVTIGQAG